MTHFTISLIIFSFIHKFSFRFNYHVLANWCRNLGLTENPKLLNLLFIIYREYAWSEVVDQTTFWLSLVHLASSEK